MKSGWMLRMSLFLRRNALLLGLFSAIQLCGGAASAQTVISVSPGSLDFGDVQAGTKSPVQRVTVTNISTSETTLTLSIDPPEFFITNAGRATLGPGQSTGISVQLSPDSFQTFTGALCIAATGQPTPTDVALTGVGTDPLRISPATYDFGSVYVGQHSPNEELFITNAGNASTTIVNGTATAPFQMAGISLTNVRPGGTSHAQAVFYPASAGFFSGQANVYLAGVSSPAVITLTGTGVTTTADAMISPRSLQFSNVPLGTTTVPEAFTIANPGTEQVKVLSLYVTPPWQVTGITAPFVLGAGRSVTGEVTFFGEELGSVTGTVNVQFNSLPPQGISLSASTVAANQLAITTFAPPLATQNFTYEAFLAGTGGTGTLTWSLADGSTLPQGLSLSSDGEISGTVAKSTGVGTYPFTVDVMDQSDPPQEASRQLTLTVDKKTGANCQNVSFDIAGSSTPIVPITDLATGTYLGQEGGLYPDGSNVDPTEHDSAGIGIAQGIGPLNANGQPDPNGVYVLMSLGISNTQQEFSVFQTFVQGDASANSKLVTVNAAQPGVTAESWADPSNLNWSFLLNTTLPQAGVTANQVAIVWFEDIDSNPTGTFPGDITTLQAEYEDIARNVHTYLPNCKLMYFTSPIYHGYSNGVSTHDPEPYGYESGFAMKLAIQDQIDGLATLNFDPNNGTVYAPWMAWGPYTWANGLLPRLDGLTWDCQDLKADGIHPSDPLGQERVSDHLQNFFKTDDTGSIWYLMPQ
jgi:Cep192 domain 4